MAIIQYQPTSVLIIQKFYLQVLMNEQGLRKFYESRACTLLGVGSISKNCIDVTIDLANEFDIPLMIIASRRQIECETIGRGYVENWSTDEFCRYVRERDRNQKILISRDHGGPWQHPTEISNLLSVDEAMRSAKKSFYADIVSGMDILHIDTSLDIGGNATEDELLERVFELQVYCHEIAHGLGREIMIEVGTEEQDTGTHDLLHLDNTLKKFKIFSNSKHIPKPTFFVAQTSTKVCETQNVGFFEANAISELIKVCNKNQFWLKEHNIDYLSDEFLKMHPSIGVHAANVAPEFGVIETRTFLNLLSIIKVKGLSDDFLKLAYDSRKWTKWMMADSNASDRDKAIIAGHYVFSCPEFKEIKIKATREFIKKKIDLDEELKKEILRNLVRYLRSLNLID